MMSEKRRVMSKKRSAVVPRLALGLKRIIDNTTKLNALISAKSKVDTKANPSR